MKTYPPTHRLLLPLLSLSLLFLPGLSAQTAPSTNATCNTCTAKWHRHGGPGGGGFASLTPAERQQLKAAMEQIKGNPQLESAKAAVKAAQQSLQQTRQTLLLQADPTLQPVLAKIQQHPESD